MTSISGIVSLLNWVIWPRAISWLRWLILVITGDPVLLLTHQVTREKMGKITFIITWTEQGTEIQGLGVWFVLLFKTPWSERYNRIRSKHCKAPLVVSESPNRAGEWWICSGVPVFHHWDQSEKAELGIPGPVILFLSLCTGQGWLFNQDKRGFLFSNDWYLLRNGLLWCHLMKEILSLYSVVVSQVTTPL